MAQSGASPPPLVSASDPRRTPLVNAWTRSFLLPRQGQYQRLWIVTVRGGTLPAFVPGRCCLTKRRLNERQ